MWKSNELLGAAQKLLDILNTPEHVNTLSAAGLTVAPLVTALTNPKSNYSAAEQAQEAFKTKLTSASVVERNTGQTLYDKLSDQVDGLSGMVGKKTSQRWEAAQRLSGDAGLRRRIGRAGQRYAVHKLCGTRSHRVVWREALG